MLPVPVLLPEDGLLVELLPVEGLLLELLPVPVLLPDEELLPCDFRQSCFALPVSVSHAVLELEPEVLLGLVLELLLGLELDPELELGLELELLGLELEPELLLGLLEDELPLLGLVVELDPVLLLGLELELPVARLELLPLPALPELWATDTVAIPASAAAMAMPSAFFIMVGDSWELRKFTSLPFQQAPCRAAFHG